MHSKGRWSGNKQGGRYGCECGEGGASPCPPVNMAGKMSLSGLGGRYKGNGRGQIKPAGHPLIIFWLTVLICLVNISKGFVAAQNQCAVFISGSNYFLFV